MLSPLDLPRWVPSPERALCWAVVAFSAGAAVPVLSMPATLLALIIHPVCPWMVLLTTLVFARLVIALAPPRFGAWRAAAVLALSIVGGGLNGFVGGCICGAALIDGRSDALSLGIYGALCGLVVGGLFGVVNAALVAVVRRSARHASATTCAARTVARLGAVASIALGVALAVAASVIDVLRRVPHEPQAVTAYPSLACALLVSVLIAALAAGVALAARGGLLRRRRWLDRVARGEETRYRLVPATDAAMATSLAVLDERVTAATGETLEGGILVRVDVAAAAAEGVYRQAEHLTPLARLA